MQKDSDNAASKILVMDDEDSFRQVITKCLTQSGFEVVSASDGKAGVSLAAETLPDLIVCDLNMPGMTGHEVLAALRRDPKLADIPLIFLTGQTQPRQVRQSMNLGADDYLTKPMALADLLSAIKVRLDRRQTQRQRQEQQMERAMRLFQGIVHDLRDPLFVVLGYTDMLRGGVGKTPEAGQNSGQILDRMQQAVLRMQAIVSEMLFLARSRTQRLAFDPGPLDLRVFCEQILADHEESHRVSLECVPDRFPVTADALRLRQALDNLLSNALKYSDGPVLVRLSSNAKSCLIEVSDQGIGIPAAEQTSIFQPFFRASNTGDRPGHGLGLSIVKSCIEQHGGSVRFLSSESQGTTFFLELPRSSLSKQAAQLGALGPADGSKGMAEPSPEAPAAMATMSTGALPEETGKLRGILVDDDPLVRSLMRDLLATANDVLIVGEAGTVAQARALVKQHEPEVVFLDVSLPDASGFDLLPDLKADASVIFVTSAEEYALQAFDCEAVDYLLKPVSLERLQKALARVRQRLATQPAGAAASSPPGGSFLVKTLMEKRLVKLSEIERIVAYGEYSWVYWQGNKKGALLRKSLRQWVKELPDEQFIRVHRRAIVNLACMERIEKLPNRQMQIHLRNTAEPIRVSLRLAATLNRKLKTLQGLSGCAQDQREMGDPA